MKNQIKVFANKILLEVKRKQKLGFNFKAKANAIR